MAPDAEAQAKQRGHWSALGVLFVAHAGGWGGAAAFVLARADWVGGGSGGSGRTAAFLLFGWLSTWLVAGGVLAARFSGAGVRRGTVSVCALVATMLVAGLGWAAASAWEVAPPGMTPPLLGVGIGVQLAVVLPRRPWSVIVGRVVVPVLVDLAATLLGRGHELDIAGGPAGAFGWLALALALVGVLERYGGRRTPQG